MGANRLNPITANSHIKNSSRLMIVPMTQEFNFQNNYKVLPLHILKKTHVSCFDLENRGIILD